MTVNVTGTYDENPVIENVGDTSSVNISENTTAVASYTLQMQMLEIQSTGY